MAFIGISTPTDGGNDDSDGSCQPTWPAGYTPVAGHFAVLLGTYSANTSNSTPYPVPSGWPQLALLDDVIGYNGNAGGLQVFGRFLVGGDTLPAMASAGAGPVSVQTAVWSEINTTTPMDATPVTSSATSGAWQPTGITTVTANATVISFFYNPQYNHSPVASGHVINGFTLMYSEVMRSSSAAARIVRATPGAQSMPTWASDNDGVGHIALALRPAGGGGGTNYSETGRSITIAATFTAPTQTYTHSGVSDETGRSITITATVTVPTQTYTSVPVDDFNRADNASIVTAGKPWLVAAATGVTIPRVTSNRAAITATNVSHGAAYDATPSLGNAMWAAATLYGGTEYAEAGLLLQINNSGGQTFYGGTWVTDGQPDFLPGWGNVPGPAFQVFKIEGGTSTMLNDVAAPTHTGGTGRMVYGQIGRNLQMWFNGLRVLTATDGATTIPLTGRPGVAGPTQYFSGATPFPAMDNWVAGTLVGAAVPTASGLSPSTATAGATITVTGTGFYTDATMVTISGVNYPVTVTSPTTGTFTAPTLTPGAYSVIVTSLGGVAATGPNLTYAASGTNYNEAGRSILVVATTTTIDQVDWKEAAAPIPVVATVTAPTQTFTHVGNFSETGLSIPVTVTTTATDQADWKEPGRSVLVEATTTVPVDRRRNLETEVSLPVVATTTATDQADFKNLAISLPINALVLGVDNQQSPGHFEETDMLVGVLVTTTRIIDQADFNDIAIPVGITATVTCTDSRRYVEAQRPITVVATTTIATLAEFRDTLSLPVVSTTALTDQADFKQPTLSVDVLSTVTGTDRAGEAIELLTVTVASTVTSTDQADFRQLARTVLVSSSVSVSTQASLAAFLAFSILARITATDRKGSTLITVLNDADALYLGGEVVDRVFCGPVQVWP